AKRAGISYRSYGEFAEWEVRGQKMAASVPGLDGHIHLTYPPFDMAIPDMKRVEIFAEEFKQFVEKGTVPRLSILRLPRDHTSGASAGAVTPTSMVAENDLALGHL